MNQSPKQLYPWQFWLTLAFAAVNIALILAIDGWSEAGDTSSLLQAIDPILQHGFDTHRSIGYPLVISLCFKITPVYYMQLIVIGQVIIFFLSVATMWHMLHIITRSATTATVFGIFYAIVPGISTWATMIHTESLTISFIVFLTASAFALLRGKGNVWALAVFFVSLCAILSLRPSNLALMGAVVVVVIGVFVLRRKYKYVLAVLAVLPLAFPTFQFVKTSEALGVPTMTFVSIINRYMLFQRSGLKINPEHSQDPELRKLLVRYADSIPDFPYNQAYDFIHFHHKQQALDSLLTAEGAPWAGFGTRIRIAVGSYPLFVGSLPYCNPKPYSEAVGKRTAFFHLHFWLYPLVLAMGLIVGILQYRRDRCVPWFTLFLLASLSAVLLANLLYGPDSFDRLCLAAAPSFLLLAAVPFGKNHLIPPYDELNNSNI